MEFNNLNSNLNECDIIRYVQARFFTIEKDPSMQQLINFHTKNKYLLMAHSQVLLKKLGNIIANNSNCDICTVIACYKENLEKSLTFFPTVKTHVNVIMHIFGYFSKQFNQSQKELFFILVDQFKNEKITLGNLLAEIAPLIFTFNNTYLANQTYFLLYSEKRFGKLFSILK